MCCGAAFALAGCTDESDGEAGGELDGDGGAQGSVDGSDVDDDQFEEFDPSNEDSWYPQLTSTYVEHGFETGHIEELDTQFEERDEPHYGNAPLETPEDETEWVDPDVIDFAMTPTEDPAQYEDTMEPLIENMEEETGRDVEYVVLDSYAAVVEAMGAGQLEVAAFSTGPTPYAVNLAGAVPFAIQVGEDEFGYRLWVITQADNDEISSLDDLAGANVAHTEPSSNSGHLAPNAAFTEEGVTPGEDYEVEFSGGHDNSANAIYQGDFDAAPICSTCYTRAAEQSGIELDQIKSVWASAPFPTTSFSHVYNLHPDLQEGVRNAFLEYDYQDTAIAEEFEGRGTWIEIDYATHFHDILVNHEVNGVTYDEDSEDLQED